MTSKRQRNQSNLIDHAQPLEKPLEGSYRFRFCGIIDKTLEQLVVLNDVTFPIKYSKSFYQQILKWGPKFCQFAVFNDITVGAICCKVVEKNVMYIMTLSVLKPYRRVGIGTRLLEKVTQIIQTHNEGVRGSIYDEHDKAESAAVRARLISKIQLHVHVENEGAIAFYLKHGFRNVAKKVGYYETGVLEVKDAFVFEKLVGEDGVPIRYEAPMAEKAQ